MIYNSIITFSLKFIGKVKINTGPVKVDAKNSFEFLFRKIKPIILKKLEINAQQVIRLPLSIIYKKEKK